MLMAVGLARLQPSYTRDNRGELQMIVASAELVSAQTIKGWIALASSRSQESRASSANWKLPDRRIFGHWRSREICRGLTLPSFT
jgi:hypothetical protein